MSETLRPAPDHRVVAWIDAQPLETLFLSAITVAELRVGVALLPTGKRRAGLRQSQETRGLSLFAGRVLPFDLGFTQAYAELMTRGSREPWLRRHAGELPCRLELPGSQAIARCVSSTLRRRPSLA